MNTELFWKETNTLTGTTSIGLTDKAFDLFGQLWAIIPIHERRRNFTAGEPIITIEGSDSLGSVSLPFNVKRISYTDIAIERPDQITKQTPIFEAEVASALPVL